MSMCLKRMDLYECIGLKCDDWNILSVLLSKRLIYKVRVRKKQDELMMAVKITRVGMSISSKGTMVKISI